MDVDRMEFKFYEGRSLTMIHVRFGDGWWWAVGHICWGDDGSIRRFGKFDLIRGQTLGGRHDLQNRDG